LPTDIVEFESNPQAKPPPAGAWVKLGLFHRPSWASVDRNLFVWHPLL